MPGVEVETERRFQVVDVTAQVEGAIDIVGGAVHIFCPHTSCGLALNEFEDGFHVFNMMDPTNPYTVGYYDTYDKPHAPGATGQGLVGGMPGAWGADVRNADGLIVISDMVSGFWAFKMDGFDGWNGHDWGMPNASSAQDWDNGPDGGPKPVKAAVR